MKNILTIVLNWGYIALNLGGNIASLVAFLFEDRKIAFSIFIATWVLTFLISILKKRLKKEKEKLCKDKSSLEPGKISTVDSAGHAIPLPLYPDETLLEDNNKGLDFKTINQVVDITKTDAVIHLYFLGVCNEKCGTDKIDVIFGCDSFDVEANLKIEGFDYSNGRPKECPTYVTKIENRIHSIQCQLNRRIYRGEVFHYYVRLEKENCFNIEDDYIIAYLAPYSKTLKSYSFKLTMENEHDSASVEVYIPDTSGNLQRQKSLQLIDFTEDEMDGIEFNDSVVAEAPFSNRVYIIKRK